MAVLRVLPYPNPFLRRRAGDVTQFDDNLKQIIADMEETMAEEEGLGLAATQVGLDEDTSRDRVVSAVALCERRSSEQADRRQGREHAHDQVTFRNRTSVQPFGT